MLPELPGWVVDDVTSVREEVEHAGISYAIGGALAIAIVGVPRGTADVDVNVFVSELLEVSVRKVQERDGAIAIDHAWISGASELELEV